MSLLDDGRRRMILLTMLALLVASWNASAAFDDGWSYRLTPYLWGSGLKGSVATLVPAPPAEVDVAFSDILDNLDFALMAIFEARSGNRIGFTGDIFYLGLSADVETSGPFFSGGEYEQDFWALGGAVTYALVDDAGTFLDLSLGVNYFDLDNELRLTEGLLSSRRIADDDSWADAVVGLRGRAMLNERWFLAGRASVAAFGGSNSFWDLYGGIGYAFNDRFSAVAGYRYQQLDREKSDFLFDVEMSGAIIGVGINF